MAGAFTHIMVCIKAMEQKKSPLDRELFRILRKHANFVYLGSVSPDLPYLCIGGSTWANLMHHENTNGTVIHGLRELKQLWPNRTDTHEAILAWLMGYASHLVTDATIHPIVTAIVGEYDSNKEPHRLCEMTQDSIIYKRTVTNNIRDSHFIDILFGCKDSPFKDALVDFWKRQIEHSYPNTKKKPNPSKWLTFYTTALDIADGDSALVRLSRHIKAVDSIIYETEDEIIQKYPEDYEKYFAQVCLPKGGAGSFYEHGFTRAVQNVQQAWTKLYQGLNENLQAADTIRNWDLDSGVDLDRPAEGATYYA